MSHSIRMVIEEEGEEGRQLDGHVQDHRGDDGRDAWNQDHKWRTCPFS